MRLTRIQFYFLGIIVLSSPAIIYKLIWLKNSVVTTGVVLYTEETRFTRTRQYYPVIQFETDKYRVTVRGHYNAPYEEGDSVTLRYIPANPTNYCINTFWNCWIYPVIIDGFLFIFWSFLFFRDIISGKRFEISRRGIKTIEWAKGDDSVLADEVYYDAVADDFVVPSSFSHQNQNLLYMSTAVVSRTEEILNHHLSAFIDADVNEIMKDFTEDSELLTPDGPIKGVDGIRSFFAEVFKLLPKGSPLDVKRMIVRDNMAYLIWSAESSFVSIPFGADTFIIEHDKIVFQNLAAHILPKQ